MKKTLEPKKAILVECPDAMKFIDLDFIPIHQIREAFGGNLARSRGVSNEGVKQFIRIMKNGQYTPEYYIPPVIVPIPEGDPRRLNDNGDEQYLYELVAGHHRFHAHLNLGEDFFYAQIVEFVSAKRKSANHWRTVYQTYENMQTNEEYVRNYATEEDIAVAVKNLVEEELASQGTPAPIDTIITDTLAELGVVGKGAVTATMNRVHKLMGNTAKVVQAISKTAREKFVAQHINHANKLPEHVLYQNFTVGGAEVEDYDYRGIAKVWDVVESNPKTLGKINIVAGTTKSTHTEVPTVRQNKITLFKKHADDIIRRTAFLLGTNVSTLMSLKQGSNYDKFCNIPIYWIPQLHGESEQVKETGALIEVRS